MAVQVVTRSKGHGGRANWRDELPTLHGARVVLRQIRVSDAESLFAMVTPEEVSRFISTPPSTSEAFEQFIARSIAQQRAGTLACFAVTLPGHDTAIGLFQVREIAPRFQTAEWGFAIGSPFWGAGLFEEGARMVMEFAFETLQVHRLEARAAVKNGRGNRALQKVGAVPEGVLRQALLCGSEYVDQVVYGIVDSEWRAAQFDRHVRRSQFVH